MSFFGGAGLLWRAAERVARRVQGRVHESGGCCASSSAGALRSPAYWAYIISLSVYAYNQGGAAAVGLVGASVCCLPSSQRHSPECSATGTARERVMFLISLARAASWARRLWSLFAGSPIWVVYVLAGGVALTASMVRPMQSALLPQLARTPEELTAANLVFDDDRELGHVPRPGDRRASPGSHEYPDRVRGCGRVVRGRRAPRRRHQGRGGGRARDPRGRLLPRVLCRLRRDRRRPQPPSDHRSLRRSDADCGGAQRPDRRRVARAARPRRVGRRIPELGCRGRRTARALWPRSPSSAGSGWRPTSGSVSCSGGSRSR